MIVNITERNQGSVWALMKCNYLTHIDANTFNLFVFGQFLQKKTKNKQTEMSIIVQYRREDHKNRILTFF